MALSLATVGGKITAAFVNLIIGQVNLQAGTRVVPTSVSTGSGTANIGTSGVVTFTTVGTSLSINGLFGSNAAKYRVVIEQTAASGTPQLTVFLRDASPADSAAGYDAQTLYSTGATAVGVANATNAATGWPVTIGSAGLRTTTLELSNPGVAATTTGTVVSADITAGFVPLYASAAIDHRATTAYGGITIKPSAGTITGRVTVTAYTDA